MAGPTGPSPKLIGILASIALAIVFVAILWFTRTTPTQTSPSDQFFPTDPSDIPDITDLAASGRMFVTMTDKQDTSRVASTLEAERFEPIGNGKRRLDHPVVWIYQRDGRAVKISADTGTVVMPDPNQPPESGILEGDVTVQTFAVTPSPGTPAADDATPTLVTKFEAPVEFDRHYLRLQSAGRFTVHSDRIDFAGHDLTVMLNEVRDRVELVDIRRGEQLVIRPDTAQPQDLSSDEATKPSSAVQTQNPPKTAGADPSDLHPVDDTETNEQRVPAITRYHIQFAQEVLARVVGTGQIEADSLDIWALLDNGRLRENAIAQINLDQSTTQAEGAPQVDLSPSDSTPSVIAQTEPTPTKPTQTSQIQPGQQGELVITWSGPLTINPLADDAAPAQLANDDITIEMNANPGSMVNFQAPHRNLSGITTHAVYHATTGNLALRASEQIPTPTEITIEGSGSIRTNSINASLLDGHISIDSAGVITTEPADGQGRSSGAQLTWRDHASFDLASNPDGSISNRLRQATFSGIVQGIQDGNQIAGSVITATLDPDSPPASALRKLRFVNGVVISKDKSSLAADTLDFDFAQGSSGYAIDPIRMAARGKVSAQTPDNTLKTESLNVTLMRDLSGKVQPRTANANTDIRFTGKNRTNAKANSLEADGVNEQVTLFGTPSKPASVTQAGSTITGQHIDLDARRRSLRVPGPGTFAHDVAVDDPNSNGFVRVSWKESMRFEDAIGSIECRGSVTAISTPDAYTKDTIGADRIEIDLSPMPISEPIAGKPLPERELLRARAYGQAMPGMDPVPAKIESRSYAHDDPGRTIGLLYLEGPQILADNQRETLTVPAPGQMLVMDREQGSNDNADNANNRTGAGPGLTRFTWQGRLDLDRNAGRATMHDTIAVHHKSLSDGQIMTLTCDTLDAAFEFASKTGQTNRLVSTDAIGSVIFSSQTRRLLADKARFNAVDNTIFASGDKDTLVTLQDSTQPAPVSARTLLWDLARDRIEINAPSPVRTPTGP